MSEIESYRYLALADAVFNQIHSLREMGFDFGDISTIEKTVTVGKTLSPEEQTRWNEIFGFVMRWSPAHMRNSFERFHQEYVRLITGQRAEKRDLTIIAYDAHGAPVSTTTKVKVANQITHVDAEAIEIVPTYEDNSFFQFRYQGRLWAVMDPAAEATGILTASRTSAPLFIPAGTDGEFTMVGLQHTTVLLHEILKTMGLYKHQPLSDLTLERVRFTNAGQHKSWPRFLRTGRSLPAYSMALNGTDPDWVPLVITDLSNVGEGEIELNIDPRLDPQTADRVLRNLQILAGKLKLMGIVMDSWSHVRINLKTGDVSLGEEDRPLLLDAGRATSLIYGGYKLSAPSAYYFPNLTAYSTGDTDMIMSERELKTITDILRNHSLYALSQPDSSDGLPNPQNIFDLTKDFPAHLFMTKEAFARLALKELYNFAAYDQDHKLMHIIETHSPLLARIIQYYYQNLDEEGDGVFPFFTRVLPLVLKIFSPEDYAEATAAYINEARLVERDEMDVEDYWNQIADHLEIILREGSGSGGRGSPQGAPITGWGMGGLGGLGSGGGPIGQARGVIRGYYDASGTKILPAAASLSLPANGGLPAGYSPMVQGGLGVFGAMPMLPNMGVPASVLVH